MQSGQRRRPRAPAFAWQASVTNSHPPICDYEGSEYQTRFWDRGDRRYEDNVEAIAIRRLLPSGGHRLLEVGAGAGRNTERYTGYQQIVLLDYSRTQLEQAQARLGAGDRYLYVAADVYKLPFAPQVFEAATMIRVLHHMADGQAALRQIRTTLSPGSVFVLEFANKRNLKAIARWLLRRQSWNPFTPEPVEFAALNFDFHPRTVEAWLRGMQFSIFRRLTVSHFRLGMLKRLVPLGILVGLDSLAQWTGALWQLSPSVFLGCQSQGALEPNTEGAFWRCPSCQSLEMHESPQGVHCQNCGHLWRKQDGIYDFKDPAPHP
jgi:ubiquinone/menaquinone biosynthesis C-methylase UbiE